ncbi:hypothetical protein ACO22_00093 [Paracoccidioides brasiliensis]|uniref:DEUBAD domain-containing protein n=1 Tax=Paracoccidioides brasiliensis TaxID=121759 RepID=A0A1D2JQ72_PARBR|nr:hypothetical protein ACO22_00093 [Paracoccidioides brasiliensis]
MTQAGVKKAAASRRGPARSSKKDPWNEELLLTSTKSRIIGVDLVKLLANPKAWTCLDEDEKKEIIALLPDDMQRHAVTPIPKDGQDPENYVIPPLPESFVRYSNSWRDAVRQFQIDLQTGRYDPEWQQQAAEAMEERAQGMFDKFKEEQFEEFWGQKQKLDYTVIAGASSKVKLGTLVENGVVRVGDVWRYSRAFGRGGEKILLEKEVRIIDRDGSSLTFAIPPGQRVFLFNNADPVNRDDTVCSDMKAEASNASISGDVKDSTSASNQVSEEQEVEVDPTIHSTSSPEPSRNTFNPPVDGAIANRSAASVMDGQADVSDNQAATESTQHIGPAIVSAAAPEPMNVDNHKCNSRSGITEISADSESELSSAHMKDQTGLLGTVIGDSGAVAPGQMNEDVPMDTTLEATASACCSNYSQSKEPVSVNGPDTFEPDTKAATASADVVTTNQQACLETQAAGITRGNAAANGTTMETETTAGPAAEQTANQRDDDTMVQPTSENVPEPSAEQPRKETIPKDIIFSGVTGPGGLANKILEIDGRITEPPNGNAWKEFRCYRDNQDMGSLWECRQTWFVRQK